MASPVKAASKSSERERYRSIEQRSVWLTDVLRRRVWNYMAGTRLPGENELAKRFRVSLRVARRALETLAQEGLVLSRRGKGSVVIREQTTPLPVRRIVAVISGARQSSTTEVQAILLGAHEESIRRSRAFEVVRSDGLDLSRPDCLMSVARGPGLPTEIGWMFVRIAPAAAVLDTWRVWGLATVLVQDDPHLAAHTVNSDGEQAAFLAVERAVKLGHRRIAYAGNTRDDAEPSAKARWQGFQLGCQRHQLPTVAGGLEFWQLDPDEAADTQRSIQARLSQPQRANLPTAIIAADQWIGCELLAACNRLGLATSRQLSVISVGMERRDLSRLPADLLGRLARASEGRPERLGQLAANVLIESHLASVPAKLLAECEWIEGDSLGPRPLSGSSSDSSE